MLCAAKVEHGHGNDGGGRISARAIAELKCKHQQCFQTSMEDGVAQNPVVWNPVVETVEVSALRKDWRHSNNVCHRLC